MDISFYGFDKSQVGDVICYHDSFWLIELSNGAIGCKMCGRVFE